MDKVIRGSRISEQSVRLRDLLGEIESELEPEGAEGEFLDLAESAEQVASSEGEQSEEAQPAEEEEPALEASEEGREPVEEAQPFALEVETLVEERLKEFEERFQPEKDEAYKSGFEDGRSKGLKEGQDQSQEEIDRFKSVLEDLGAQWKTRYKDSDQSLVDLVLAISRKIIGEAVEVREEPILEAVRECLDHLQDKSQVVIKVHPDNLETIRQHRNDWLQALEGIQELIIESDGDISPGGCIVETPKGDVDAQIEERIERLKTVLIDEIRREGEADEHESDDSSS